MIPLNQISVATPCHESWDDMTGDDKKRFCCGCKKNVFNLSAMTEAEAQTVLSVGNPCVRFYRRVDGTVLTQDCPVGVKRVRRRRAVAATGAIAALAGAMGGRQVLADATMGAPPVPSTAHSMGMPATPAIMGDVALPVPPKPTQGQPMMGKVAAPQPKPPVRPNAHPHPPKKTHKPSTAPVQGGVTLGRIGRPVVGELLNPEAGRKPAPKKHGQKPMPHKPTATAPTSTPQPPPPHPVPTMGIVAPWHPSHDAPTLPNVPAPEPKTNT